MKINSRFTFDKIRHDRDNDIHLVLDLVAPKSEWQAKRPPLCIIPVVDRSGSMSGEKLHYAKQSLLKLVEHLSSEDYFGLVSFESYVHVDAKPEKMTPERKEQMKALIGRYQVAGGTGLSAGLLEALKMANNMDLHESTLTRVILFTDGEPTHGVTTQEGLCELVQKQMGRATVSAFGYGVGAKQELLQGMSSIGKGNYAFVKDPDSALSAFGKELGGLLSTYAQNIQVSVKPRNGHVITEVLTDADVEEDADSEITLKLPQLLSEETFNVVLSTKMSKQKGAGPRQVNAFDVSVTYQVLDADGNMVTKTEDAKAKVQFVKDGEEQTHPTREVDEIVARAQLVRTQIAAEEAAKKGDYMGAGALLSAFESSAKNRGHSGVAAVSSHLHGMYGTSVNYVASEGSRTSLRGAMTRGVGASSMVAEDSIVLASAGYAVSNSTQALYEEAFQAPVVTPDPEQNPGQPVRAAADWTSPIAIDNTSLWGNGLGGGGAAGSSGGLGLGISGGGLGGTSGLGQSASNIRNPILVAVPQDPPAPVEAQKPAGKTSRKKPPSTKSGLKKSRSQRW